MPASTPGANTVTPPATVKHRYHNWRWRAPCTAPLPSSHRGWHDELRNGWHSSLPASCAPAKRKARNRRCARSGSHVCWAGFQRQLSHRVSSRHARGASEQQTRTSALASTGDETGNSPLRYLSRRCTLRVQQLMQLETVKASRALRTSKGAALCAAPRDAHERMRHVQGERDTSGGGLVQYSSNFQTLVSVECP